MLCLCACELEWNTNVSLKHPVQTLLEESAKQEPSLSVLLKRWGYTQEQIETPLSVKLFQPKGDVTLTWIAKHTSALVQIGWGQGGEVHSLLMTENIMKIPSPLKTTDAPVGLFVTVKDEQDTVFTLDEQKNVRVYPSIDQGENIESSFLICWEVDGDEDFNDVIIQLVGVEAVLE